MTFLSDNRLMTNKHFPNSKYTLIVKIDGVTLKQYFRADQLTELNTDIAQCVANGYNFTFKVL